MLTTGQLVYRLDLIQSSSYNLLGVLFVDLQVRKQIQSVTCQGHLALSGRAGLQAQVSLMAGSAPFLCDTICSRILVEYAKYIKIWGKLFFLTQTHYWVLYSKGICYLLKNPGYSFPSLQRPDSGVRGLRSPAVWTE